MTYTYTVKVPKITLCGQDKMTKKEILAKVVSIVYNSINDKELRSEFKIKRVKRE